MNDSPLATAASFDWSKATTILLNNAGLTSPEIEEVFLNFPKVKKISTIFSDGYERFYVEGVTDLGKRLGVVMYIIKQKIVITFIKKL